MIEEGTVVYYLDEDLVHSGRVTDVTLSAVDLHSALTATEPVKGRM